MKIELISDKNLHETRVALLEDGDLAELYVERADNRRLVGNIYMGQVANVLPGMDAAFVDVGLEKNAFLHACDILVDSSDFEFEGQNTKVQLKPSIRSMLKQGQHIMVQVLKDPGGTKGAKVTTHVTLPGRMVVLMPTVDHIGVSRRIEGEEERSRLKSMMERIKPQNMGVIVRTVAEGKSEQDFVEELAYLCRLWEEVQAKAEEKAPALIHAEGDVLYRCVRDLFTAQVSRFVVHREHAEKVRSLTRAIAPQLLNRIEIFDGDMPFDAFNLENKVDRALHTKVWLKSGGYLMFDSTEALMVVDVNTGKYVGSENLQDTILKTNLEAAREIARQLRLRNISGIIIIDFIDMEQDSHKKIVVDALSEAMKRDRNKSNVLGMTGLGLVEMTRKKSRQRLDDIMLIKCPCCSGDGRLLSPETVALDISREALDWLRRPDCEAVVVNVHSCVAQYIASRCKAGGFFKNLQGKTIYVRANTRMKQERFEIMEYTVADDVTGCDIYC
ncbi:MAG: Rne/Rng family ribonuclease [Christensenellales bacterium]|jgi:ribonuclease G